MAKVEAEQRMTRHATEPLEASMRSYGFKICGNPERFGGSAQTRPP